MTSPDYFLGDRDLPVVTEELKHGFATATPFPHIVIDNFFPERFVDLVMREFPGTEHPVWLDWRKRSGHQPRKQGPGNASRFGTLSPAFEIALQQLNALRILRFMEAVTGVEKLLPDPNFRGGGMHQTLPGGFLDVHTDFNENPELDLVRRLNALIYLNPDWQEGDGGELELWDGPAPHGTCQKRIAPIANRCVIFKTDKTSFHGHPQPWRGRSPRRSLALYYYTAAREPGAVYNRTVDFQGVNFEELPKGT